MDQDSLKRYTDCVYFLASPLTCKKGAECEYRHNEIARLNPRDCWYWLSGQCLNPTCAFRHPPLDGHTGASVPSEPTQTSLPANKTMVPCYFFFNGSCNKGDRCSFLHGPDDSIFTVKPVKNDNGSTDALNLENKTSSGNRIGLVSTPTDQSVAAPKNLSDLKLQPKEDHQLEIPKDVKQQGYYLELSASEYKEAAVSRSDSSIPDDGFVHNVPHLCTEQSSEEQVNSHIEPEERWESSPHSPGFDVLVHDEVDNLGYEEDSEYVTVGDRDEQELDDQYFGYEFKDSVEYDTICPEADILYEQETYDGYRFLDRGLIHANGRTIHAYPRDVFLDPRLSRKRIRMSAEMAAYDKNLDLRDHLRRRREIKGPPVSQKQSNSHSQKQSTLFFLRAYPSFSTPNRDSSMATVKSSSMDAEKAANGESPPERCPVEEVALVVPETDDPSLPVMTFRAWFLGIASCVLLIFLNTFFTFRTQPLTISAILMQIAVLPIGRFMAATLPTKEYGFLGSRFTFNPGPFNMKEHVIITIFANCGVSFGGGDAYSIGAITVMKAYYKQSLSFLCALFIVLTTQMMGYGWAGILRRYLVDPVEMWWPANLAQVSLFRALHEKEPKSKGLTRMQFFLIAMGASFLYYALPGYLFMVLTFFSWICWAWPHSITAQQIGSGYHGLGIGAFTLDWAGISAYHGSPLVSPWSSIVNVGIGFIMFIYIILPLCYWKFNTFDAHKFPIFSNQLFTASGHKYDTTKILTPEYVLNVDAYNKYSKLYLSPLFALSIGSGFARFTATLTHVALFNGRDIWRQSRSAMSNAKLDIHGRLMKAYKQVPEWWFLSILFGSMALSLLMAFVWKTDVQLPWWGMLFAFGLAFIVTLPIGVIQATTNQQPGYDIIAQFMIGYVLPGQPIANLLFKIYGRISTVHALSFLSDLKLGHYMKIPPRCMYTAQLVGTLVAGVVNLAVAWWMLDSIKDICMDDKVHHDSPWTCPKYRVTFDASVIWGLIGPKRLFGPGGLYRNLVWLFLIGAVLPVPIWVLSKIFPEKKWIPLINIPVITYGFAGMPPATPANIASWLVTGMIFNYFVFRYNKRWWQKYNYVLSAALDAGTAFMGVLIFFALQNAGHNLKWWGSELDHCPLATCPTAPGIEVDGCPVFK